jgi:hypothetical protein
MRVFELLAKLFIINTITVIVNVRASNPDITFLSPIPQEMMPRIDSVAPNPYWV